MRTICNPINISYRYQRGQRSRESADPAVVVYKDTYFLFASHGEGYWTSQNLADWEFVHVDTGKHPQFELYAPATCVVGDRMYLTHSQCGNILYSDDPFDPDSWVDIGKPLDWWDPAFFYEDGYVYAYHGATRDKTLEVCKLDPAQNMRMVGEPYPTAGPDIANRGCERRGHHNEIDDAPWFEGPWMNKYQGTYYLQCAVPGTEFDTYTDSCFVSDSPVGPFTYCENSPVSFKATGFLRGCGHGCLFEDLNGHWWKVQTNDISVNHGCERRISIYPAAFVNKKLYVNTLRSDYPMLVPTENPDPFNAGAVDWQLLSYGKHAEASSTLDEAHAPRFAADEYMATWWSAKTGGAGEWFSLDLGKTYTVSAVQVNFADQGVSEDQGGRGIHYGYRYVLEYSTDGENWKVLVDRSGNTKDMPHDYIHPEDVIQARWLKITNCARIPADGLFAISDLRVFGPASGDLPEKAPDFTAVRGEDARDMLVTIERVPGAQGYYIRFGIAPDELYTHYQVMDDQLDGEPVRIGCLNRNTVYYVAVEAYNEAGIVPAQMTVQC